MISINDFNYSSIIKIKNAEQFKEACKHCRVILKQEKDKKKQTDHLQLFRKTLETYLLTIGKDDERSHKRFAKLVRLINPFRSPQSTKCIATHVAESLPNETTQSQQRTRHPSPLAQVHSVETRGGSPLSSSKESIEDKALCTHPKVAVEKPLVFQLKSFLSTLRVRKCTHRKNFLSAEYELWMRSSFGNSCICMLRELANRACYFPLSHSHQLIIRQILQRLHVQKNASDFHYQVIANEAIEIFEEALHIDVRSFENSNKKKEQLLRQKTSKLLTTPAMRQLELVQINRALAPLMAYLDGKNSDFTQRQIQEALSIFRRWGIIDRQGKIHEQIDMMELLDRLLNRLIDYKEIRPDGQFKSKAYFDTDSEQWSDVSVSAADKRELIRLWHEREGTAMPSYLSETQREAHFQMILSKIDQGNNLLGLLPTFEDRFDKPYQQTSSFYGFTILKANEHRLLPLDGDLTLAIEEQIFARVDAMAMFYIELENEQFQLKHLQIPLHHPINCPRHYLI